MSPGPVSTAQRGGFVASRGAPNFHRMGADFVQHMPPGGLAVPRLPIRSAPAYATRDLGAHARQRAELGVSEDGRPQFTLAPDERLTVGQDEDGNVTVSTEPANVAETEETEPAVEIEIERPAAVTAGRNIAPRQMARPAGLRERLAVTNNPDGSVTISPDAGNDVVVSGDPAAGRVVVTEEPVAEE